jgi:nitrogen fixation protein FixH
MSTTTADQWRHFPRYMMLAMALVMGVNARFIYKAVTTFPGAASSDDFDTSNAYDSVLAAKARQDALGWTEQVSAHGNVPVISLTGPGGVVLDNAVVTAQAERPIGTDVPLVLNFTRAGGVYAANSALPAGGQWDLRLDVWQAGHEVRVTRRLIIK